MVKKKIIKIVRLEIQAEISYKEEKDLVSIIFSLFYVGGGGRGNGHNHGPSCDQCINLPKYLLKREIKYKSPSCLTSDQLIYKVICVQSSGQ